MNEEQEAEAVRRDLERAHEMIVSGKYYAQEIEDSNKYDRKIVLKPNGMIDVYSVIRAYEPIDTAIQHAIKKLLAGGQRGYKNTVKDYKEAIESIKDCITYLETK